jgi:UDP-N-acetylglucosamine acyltransferase
VRIGRFAMIQGISGANQDVVPFMIVTGRGLIAAVNVVGLRRGGFSSQDRLEIKQAFRILFRQGSSLPNALAQLRAGGFGPAVQEIVSFCEAPSKRGIGLTYYRDAPSQDE